MAAVAIMAVMAIVAQIGAEPELEHVAVVGGAVIAEVEVPFGSLSSFFLFS